MSTTTQEAAVAALGRLLAQAQSSESDCRVIAEFLLGLYNGNRFKFDLTDFRLMDTATFKDCLLVLAMDQRPVREVHTYFQNGGATWERLAKYWNIRDYTRAPRAKS